MQDLQELFESLGTDEFTKLAELIDKKSLNPTSISRVHDYISIVYCGEMNVSEAEVDAEQMQQLIDSFILSVGLYASVVKGDMIMKGRMRLTDGQSAKFSLTQQGISNVEQLLKKSNP